MLTTQELRKRLDAVPMDDVVREFCDLAAEHLVMFTIETRRKGFAVTVLTQDGEGESNEVRVRDAIYAALEAIDDENEIVAEAL
jgi:hypothetical protein